MTLKQQIPWTQILTAGLVWSLVGPVSHGNAESSESVEISIPAEATFEHRWQQVAYRTELSLLGNWAFNMNSSGTLEARLLLSSHTPTGIASWGIPNSPGAGPTEFYIIRGDRSQSQLQQWLKAGGHSGIAPELIIPLSASNSSQPDLHEFENASPVAAGLFIRPCNSEKYLRYGELFMHPGQIRFQFTVDATGVLQAEVSASEIALNVEEQTWLEFRETCNPNGLLPAVAVDGLSRDLGGTSRLPDPDPESMTAGFEILATALMSLAFQERLNERSMIHLMTIAERARRALGSTYSEQASHRVDTFRHRVRILEKQGRVDVKGASRLKSSALDLQEMLTRLRTLPIPEPDPALSVCPDGGNIEDCPDTLSSCAFLVLHVDGETGIESPDGTRDRPFPTLNAALAHAAAGNACGVSLRLAPGFYEEDLTITRHTKILGETGGDGFLGFSSPFLAGSVENSGPYFLRLRNLTLSQQDGEKGVGVSVAHPCASTRLDNVTILRSRGLGLFQKGGSFAFVDVEVNGTQAIEGNPSSGTGILLTCGANGHMADVTLRGNESAGLIASGLHTNVEALDLVVLGTRTHPDYLAQQPTGVPWGAVHIRDGAYVAGRGFRIAHNWVIGIHANAGGRAFFEQGTVERTLGLDRVAPSSGAAPGGINVGAYRSAHLEMWDFSSIRADLCGAQVALEGELDLHGRWVLDASGRRVVTSEISHCTIGACVSVPDYSLERLSSAVAYKDNEINLDTAEIVIPDPLGSAF